MVGAVAQRESRAPREQERHVTLLVVGSAGQLGREMVRVASVSRPVVGLSRVELDVTDSGAVRAAVEVLAATE